MLNEVKWMFVVGGTDRAGHADPLEAGRGRDHLPDVTLSAA